MSKKQSLLKLFSRDRDYNYHIIKLEDQEGHLIYLMRNGSELISDSLEFAPTLIVEELIAECGVKIEKIAPAIFFTEENNTEKLRYELGEKISEDSEFSTFVNSIKDEYRILEVKDTLLYKKDPKGYEEAKRKEKAEQQQELLEEMLKQHDEKISQREKYLLSYNNDLIKLLADQFEGKIEFEKREFNLNSEFENIVSNLVDAETWIKIDEIPFVCIMEIISLEKDRVNVYLTDNNEYSYTATLRFEKTDLLTENVERIEKSEKPDQLSDYKVLSIVYSDELSLLKSDEEWEFKNDTERLEIIIDYLAPIFKIKKDEKEKEYVDAYLKEHKHEDADEILPDYMNEHLKDSESDDCDDCDDCDGNCGCGGCGCDSHKEKKKKKKKKNKKKNKNKKLTNPSDWYFDVWVSKDKYGDGTCDPSCIALSKGGGYLDDSLGSHNLGQNIIDALNRAGIFGDSEMMEAVWEVNDYESKTKEDIIKSMENEGFVYSENMLGNFEM
jgi:hypothetical protein